jgi:hypothetical protein
MTAHESLSRKCHARALPRDGDERSLRVSTPVGKDPLSQMPKKNADLVASFE